MDIDYHYFAVKTLAYHSGFSKEDAQTIAYYSQQVDDYVCCVPMFVDACPTPFFTEHGLAQKVDKLWRVLPHATGIDIVHSIEKEYQRTTLSAFHFLPGRSIKEIEQNRNFTREEYRCVRASENEAELIWKIVTEAIEEAKKKCCERSLMQLGMALHTFADTYAHCGYSGLEGWENKAEIRKAFNQQSGKEEVSEEERFLYKLVPHIGHGNAGHVPDVCTYEIDVAMQTDEKDSELSCHIARSNTKSFLECAQEIHHILCQVSGQTVMDEQQWLTFSERLLQGMQMQTKFESDKNELTKHWKCIFPEVEYEYEKNQRFYLTKATPTEEVNGLVSHVTEAFFDYNELSFRRASLVLGESEILATDSMKLLEMDASEENGYMLTEGKENTAVTDEGEWEPTTELGLAVTTAGFTYIPKADMIGSTMNNVQRLGGYCHGYDVAAILISSIIDCEPIYFTYAGYEWMMELWKGQYGIETGCEMGIYYRKQGQPESPEEKGISGKMYACVSDDWLLDMTFSLEKNGQEISNREWTKHWWLTGFQWGVYSQPEELTMKVGIRFPEHDMQQAFLYGGEDITGGLKALGYQFTEVDDCTVTFCFGTPYNEQPAIRDKMRNKIQTANNQMVGLYNDIRKKYNITCNDPNVISEAIMKHANMAEKELYRSLVYYFNQKSHLKTTVYESRKM